MRTLPSEGKNQNSTTASQDRQASSQAAAVGGGNQVRFTPEMSDVKGSQMLSSVGSFPMRVIAAKTVMNYGLLHRVPYRVTPPLRPL